MNNFKEFLQEAGKVASEIIWERRKGNLFGKFKVKEQIFDIEVTKMDNETVNSYQFKFYREGNTKMFNDMVYALTVVPTIKNALDYSMSVLTPDILVFASSDNSTARKSMYKAEAEIIAKKYNYLDIAGSSKLKEMGYSSDIIFGVYKNEDILQKAINEL